MWCTALSYPKFRMLRATTASEFIAYITVMWCTALSYPKFRNIKTPQKKNMCTSSYVMCAQSFSIKSTCRLGGAKKTKNANKSKLFCDTSFVFFIDKKSTGFLRNHAYRLPRCTCLFFLLELVAIKNMFIKDIVF
jgi:hypothetical protein